MPYGHALLSFFCFVVVVVKRELERKSVVRFSSLKWRRYVFCFATFLFHLAAPRVWNDRIP
jgi:hypothetical protein